MTETQAQRAVVARFEEALKAGYDHVTLTHAELSAGYPGNPDGESSLARLLRDVSDHWTADHHGLNGQYLFSRKHRDAVKT